MVRQALTALALGLGLAASVLASPGVISGGSPTPAPAAHPWASPLADAESRLNRGDLLGARASFERIAADNPGTAGAEAAIRGAANTYVFAQDHRGAVEYLERVIARSTDPRDAQSGRTAYTLLHANVDSAQRRAFDGWRVAQERYDDISWFNIFRIFEKLRLRGDLKTAKADLDRTSEVKMFFDPTYFVQITGPVADPAPAPAPTPTAVPPTPATPIPTPPPAANTNSPTTANANTSTSGSNGNTSSSSDDLVFANTPGLSSPTVTAVADSQVPTTGASPAAPGSTTTVGAGQDPVSADDSSERTRAVKVLESEIQRILALVPEDKREEARRIIVTGGGFASAGASVTATPAAAPSLVTTPTGPAQPTLAVVEGPDATASTAPVEPNPAPVASVEPAQATTATTDTVANPVAATPAPTAPPPVPADNVGVLQSRVVAAYREVQSRIRAGDRSGIAAAQAAYQQATQALRARMYHDTQAVGASAAQPSTTVPAAPSTGATASTTRPSVIQVPPVVPTTTGSVTPVGIVAPGAPAASGTRPVSVDPARGNGRPVSDPYLRTIRSGLQNR